ncbi:MAG: hypothetical protein AB7V18_04115 [Pyrinomonadaceae bacterium]
MTETANELELSVIVTVVSGRDALRENLRVLTIQMDEINGELIVPYDKWSNDISDLAVEFPTVRFHLIEDLGLAFSSDVSAHQHRLYDRRRAVGLGLARGKIVAITEDHARPSDDWCRQLIRLHIELPYEVIGGAVENGIDRPINWAWYYCDFGRYGRPFSDGEAEYISDVNVSYKRQALALVQDLCQETYSETTMHWALREHGARLFLDGRLVVFQMRPAMSHLQALRERIAWGRVFAETRRMRLSAYKRPIFAAGAFILPLILLFRVFRHMFRQTRTVTQVIQATPFVLFLLIGWSLGEMIGYLAGSPYAKAQGAGIAHSSGLIESQP